MSETFLTDLPLPASVILGAIAAAAYVVGTARHRRRAFTMTDALMVAIIMAIVSAVTMPLLDAADESAKETVLQRNLQTLRRQIEIYKLDHGDSVPLLFKGGFPQLKHVTNGSGEPGPSGVEYPFGPYLPMGVPVNPYTGVSEVKPTETFPPTEYDKEAGWLYHQATGRIAPAVAE